MHVVTLARSQRSVARRGLAFAVGLGLGVTAAVAPSAALAEGRVDPCPKRKHEIKRTHGSVVWERGGSLFGCVAGYANPQLGGVENSDPGYDHPHTKARRLGPWSRGSRIVFDGVEATWAYRTTSRAGEPVDRMYAIDVREGKAWLRGARPSFDLGDRVVDRLALGMNFAAWITTRGTVMAGAEGGFGADDAQPDPFDLELVGAGAPGLAPTLNPQGNRLLIGQFPNLDAAGRATFRLKRLSDLDMENEQCIGSYRWETTVVPPGGTARVGGVWRAAYFPTEPECTGF